VVLVTLRAYIAMVRWNPRGDRMVTRRNSEPGGALPSKEDEAVDEEVLAAETDLILTRLEEGIARENKAMDALLSRLRTTLITA
jgi:hypothetical protein